MIKVDLDTVKRYSFVETLCILVTVYRLRIRKVYVRKTTIFVHTYIDVRLI